MDPTRQGREPSGRGAYYNPAQFPDLPSPSSRQPWPPLLEQVTPPLQMNPRPQFQPHQGGDIGDQSSTRVGIPTDGNIWSDDAPFDVPMPGSQTSVAHRPSTPNVIGSQRQCLPQHGSGALFSALGYDGVFNPHASVYRPWAAVYAQPRFAARGGNATSNDPNTSAGVIAPPANQGARGGPVAGAPNRQALQDVETNPALATNPASSDWLAFLLDQDNGELRAEVTQSVLEDVRKVMGSDAGLDVLLALLRSLGRANEFVVVQAIVKGMLSPQYNGASLMAVANHWSGETALRVLVRVAARNFPEVLQQLFRCLIDGWIMEQSKGPELLEHFFATLPYSCCSIFTRELAVPRFRDMATSYFGGMSVMLCLENATKHELGHDLEDTILTHAVEISKKQYGVFLQEVFKRGRHDQLEDRIRALIVDDLVEWSTDKYGHFVVQACFRPRASPSPVPVPPLQRGLEAFLRLPDERLRELVRDRNAYHVLGSLLDASVDHGAAPAEAMQLAKRILGMPRTKQMLNSVVRRVIDKSKP